jgi:hypothetical protein
MPAGGEDPAFAAVAEFEAAMEAHKHVAMSARDEAVAAYVRLLHAINHLNASPTTLEGADAILQTVLAIPHFDSADVTYLDSSDFSCLRAAGEIVTEICCAMDIVKTVNDALVRMRAVGGS